MATQNPDSIRALRRGAVAYRRRERASAVARVRAFQRWLRAGSPLSRIPEVPSDNDYRLARGR